MSAESEISPARRTKARIKLLILACAIAAAFGVGAVRDARKARLEFQARSIDRSYPFRGEGAGGMKVGLGRVPGGVRWRVNSAGTHDCHPGDQVALWNYASGELRTDEHGGFTGRGRYSSPDTIGHDRYRKQVSYRIRGRIDRNTAAGRFWRRDRYFRAGKLSFACVRAGRWRAERDTGAMTAALER